MTAESDRVGVTLPMVVRGGAAGAVAYFLGYAFAYLTAADAVGRAVRAFQPLSDAGARFAPAWKVAGWAFSDAHFVGTQFAGRTVNTVAFGSVEYLYLVPPILLLLAGGLAAALAHSETPRAGLVAGVCVTAGYLPLAVILALLLQHANVRPSLLRALVVAGVVYPVAFGGIGGALAVIATGE